MRCSSPVRFQGMGKRAPAAITGVTQTAGGQLNHVELGDADHYVEIPTKNITTIGELTARLSALPPETPVLLGDIGELDYGPTPVYRLQVRHIADVFSVVLIRKGADD
ncbi:Uncharacterised protein [Mycobacteroides abscessus subsp. abscessus]|nr:Uncharacterised protein [Mycobacteroides abscessus subsp. abscessus]SIF99956.1 Uncharacterised protein [Mycobacteroides abscessus subsp. abscessus]SIG17439.1 Uncharacterised protein [Mycobacteroides abscessus subsp. abscessus]SIG50378.1 Uncharacterised protein [Mycobacteroides abscessus subsp. abscessus]SII32269.1 Uncharacterised protein [Mycobacteroides abscessus subsp. abscessus]